MLPSLRVASASVVLCVAVLAGSTALGKDPALACSDICDTLTATTCAVTTVHEIAAGADIDCTGARDISLSGSGELRVHDGQFAVRGKSITLGSGARIDADCPQGFVPVGYRLIVDEDLIMVAASQAKLEARCTKQGGRIVVDAGGDITIDALGADASGDAPGAPGGAVRLAAGGTVSIDADLQASATQGAAAGGVVHVAGGTITVDAELRARGSGTSTVELPGGEIRLEAAGDVTVASGGGLNAGSAKGAGGIIGINAGGIADVRQPLKATGTSASVGVGGSVGILADEIKVSADITVTGGRMGGTIALQGLEGGVVVGTTAAAVLDATGNTNQHGGTVSIASQGGDVVLGSSATVHATGGSGAEGGRVIVDGVNVTTSSGTKLYADGAAPAGGGEIEITARAAMDLDGTVQANNQGSKTFIYKDTVPVIDTGITGYELLQMGIL